MKALLIKGLGLSINIGAYIAPKYTAKKGFEIFSSPFRIKLSDRQKDFMRSAELSKMKTDDYPEIQVYKWGNGSKKILFLHGWQSHTFRWIKYIMALKDKDYTIYAFDAPGSGYSSGKILNVPLYGEVFSEFIKRHGNMDYIVGHSLGAFMLLYRFFIDKTLTAKKVVMLASPGNAMDFVETFQDMVGLNKRAMKIILAYFEEKYKHPSYYATERFVEGMEVPGLIIHDKDDKDAPFHYAEKMAASWPNAETYFTKGLGHKLRDPKVVKRVVTFLEKE